jgi:hypothetical protein
MSDIEGKVAREAMSECGKGVSFQKAVATAERARRGIEQLKTQNA